MFDDARSKRVIVLSHCLLNRNSISDGTADFPGQFTEIIELLMANCIGMIQLPCPELLCLIEANPLGKPFITHVVMRQGALQGYYRKINIKNEETACFSPGQAVPVFQSDGLTFGIAICADIESETVFAECGRQGAKIVFELAAPGLYGEQATRNW